MSWEPQIGDVGRISHASKTAYQYHGLIARVIHKFSYTGYPGINYDLIILEGDKAGDHCRVPLRYLTKLTPLEELIFKTKE